MNQKSDFVNGMTVKELKEILKDWPDVDSQGADTEVWIETGRMLSSPVVRYNSLGSAGDLLLKSNAFENNEDE